MTPRHGLEVGLQFRKVDLIIDKTKVFGGMSELNKVEMKKKIDYLLFLWKRKVFAHKVETT